MYFTVHGKEHDLKRLKGKTITEFGANLEKAGFPSEFYNGETRDRAKFIEKRNSSTQRKRGSLTKEDSQRIAKEMGALPKREAMKRLAAKQGITCPNSKEHGKVNYYQGCGDCKTKKRKKWF